ncbi:MAG: elongation factor G, partial [Deltaproteobacteria bacterium]|nr:elongation factor G [Deltaproteobacteria bacterium]
ARRELVESIAETNEELMEKYFAEEDLSIEDIRRALPAAFASRAIYPVLCGVASKNIAAAPLLDFIIDTCPAPTFRGTQKGVNPETREEITREISPDAQFSGLVFKTVADPFSGKLTIFRVLSGTLLPDSAFLNSTLDVKERFGAVLALNGKRQEPVEMVYAGDIVAVAKLKDTRTGDTLCDPKSPIRYTALPPLRPVVTYALRARVKGEEDKVMNGLNRLIEEDPTLQLRPDEQSGEILLSGMGQVHIEVVKERLKRKFGGLEVELGLPTVPYRETVRKKAEAEGKHKKQTGGRGQFGVCYLEISPLERGAGYEFVNDVFGGAIPKQFIPAVDKGCQEAMIKGPLTGFPVVDVKIRCLDGKYHDVDSSEMAFKIAGSLGFRAAMEKADPVLLEPIMSLEITVPNENMGDVYGDISSRRGRVLGSESRGKFTVVKAEAPYAEVLTYATDLTAMTSGRGEFTMEMVRYAEVPAQISAKIIEKAQAAKEG